MPFSRNEPKKLFRITKSSRNEPTKMRFLAQHEPKKSFGISECLQTNPIFLERTHGLWILHKTRQLLRAEPT